MGKFNDLTGKKFGKLTVSKLHGRTETTGGTKFYLWLCKCDCGKDKVCRSNNLVSGRNVSCGCRMHGHTKHGKAYHPLYAVRSNMIQRCHNKKSGEYKNYGARGITVCQEWRDSPSSFIEHMESIGWTKGSDLTIDRIDNDKDYTPGNVRLATKVQQGRNKRTNVVIDAFGKTMTMADWSESKGIPYSTLQARIYRGWTPERALTEEVKKKCER